MTRLAFQGQHVAFEPIPRLHLLLCRRFPRVKCYRLALSDRKGTVQFSYFREMDGFSGFLRRDVGIDPGQVEEITVGTERLDEILPVDLQVALIKIDVEGAEYRVIRGAERVIRRSRPFIVFECGKGGLDIYGHSPEQVFDLLNDCGLTIAKLTDWSPAAVPLSRQAFVDEFFFGKEYLFVASP
jgi:FkbM family methyltransferase